MRRFLITATATVICLAAITARGDDCVFSPDLITKITGQAEAGSVASQYLLGEIYANGWGVTENDARAVIWLHKSAEQGHAKAQYKLGTMYDYGMGVPMDYMEAARWYGMAAVQGDVSAQINMGVMFGKGEGVPQDYVLGYAWTNIARASGAETAHKNMRVLVRRMTSDQIAEAQKLSREIWGRIDASKQKVEEAASE